MNDRAPIRDRTLVLRILVPRLDQRLREKMKEVEEAAAATNSNNGSSPNKSSSQGGGGGNGPVESLLDLEGVSCEPTADRNRTMWNFHCDGTVYPAQLVNLPCPVEIHKTIDHASYYKAADVAQMLIVYEDALSFDEAMQEKPVEGFPSYYHSGLTPPMHRVVERRFEKCFTSRDRKAVPPPRTAVQDVEEQLLDLMEKLQKDEKGSGNSKTRSNKLPTLTTATKDLVEIEEEVVDYEPWMDDNQRQPMGIEFDADDTLAKVHPEIWLSPETIQSIQEECKAIEEAAAIKAAEKAAEKAAQSKPPTKKKKSKKKSAAKAEAAAAAAAAEDAAPKPKKGIPSRKNATPVNDIDLAALGALTGETNEDELGDLGDLGFDFGDLDGLDL